jgi:hypothetical protein
MAKQNTMIDPLVAACMNFIKGDYNKALYIAWLFPNLRPLLENEFAGQTPNFGEIADQVMRFARFFVTGLNRTGLEITTEQFLVCVCPPTHRFSPVRLGEEEDDGSHVTHEDILDHTVQSLVQSNSVR